MTRSPVFVLGLFVGLPTLLAAAETNEAEKEARAVVQRYFAAYAAKDLDGFMALWSDKAPDVKSRKQTMQRIFAETGDIRLRKFTIVQAEAGEASARLRVRVELSGTDRRSGELHADLGERNCVLVLKRAEGAWKVWLDVPAEQELLVRLLAAGGKGARQDLYRRNKDLLTTELLYLANLTSLKLAARGLFAEATRLNELAFEVAEGWADKVGLARCHFYRGRLFYSQARYPEASADFERSRALYREAKRRAGEAVALNAAGVVFETTGRYVESLRCFQDSLTIARELGDHEAEAHALGNLGNVYKSTGRYAEALRHYEDGLRIARQLGDRAMEAARLGNLGVVYKSTGRYAEALRYQQDSLRIARQVGDREGECGALNNIGNIYSATGRDDEALRCFQDGLKIEREVGNRAGEAITLNNIGNVCLFTRRYNEALRYYQECLEIERALGDRGGEAGTLGNIGRVYSVTGKYDEALASCEAGRKLAESLGDPSALFQCSWGIGDVHRARKHWAEAADAYRQTIRSVEQVRGGAREQSLQTSFLAQYVRPYHGLTLCLLGQGRLAEAFAVTERAKARALVDVLRTGKADVRKGMTADQRRQEQQLRERLTALAVELEGLKSHRLNPKRQEELFGQLDRARQDYDAFRRDLFLRKPDLQAQRGEFTPVSLADLGRDLFAARPKLMILLYLVGNEETLLFVLRPGERPGDAARLTVHRIEVGETALTEAVEQFRAACQKPGGGAPDGADLYRLLLAPVEDTLTEALQVVVVPDGPLYTLPFHALRDEDGPYLLERCAVGYAPSATALVEMARLGQRRRKDHATGGGLLAVGLGDFGRREARLPAAEPEAREVARLFGERGEVLLGGEATKTRLRAVWKGRRYLHFATHGRLNEGVPLYSSVVLTPADSKDEGVLYARDMLDEDLTAELAVLSACQTGLGKRERGEGILGLTWAWFVAGVPATVASQWSVADDSTARLMQVFYTELKGGAPKAEALRRAQLALLKDRKTRHPFYWAPFALSGDPW